MPMFPSLQLLCSNVIADSSIQHLMPERLIDTMPDHTRSDMAIFKQPITSPCTIQLQSDMDVRSTAYSLGVFFSLRAGIEIVCQLAEHNVRENTISFNQHDVPGQLLPYTHTLDVYYDSTEYSAAQVQSAVKTIGVDMSLPARVVSEYVSVAFDYSDPMDRRQMDTSDDCYIEETDEDMLERCMALSPPVEGQSLMNEDDYMDYLESRSQSAEVTVFNKISYLETGGVQYGFADTRLYDEYHAKLYNDE